MMCPDETIVAIASAPGAGGRAIIRLSGPEAFAIVARVFQSTTPIDSNRRRVYSGWLAVTGIFNSLPAQFIAFPSGRSFTGQPIAEIQTISSPPMIEQVMANLLAAGARVAQPGEFTLRAFLAGKLDLPRAEAVLAVIESGSRVELRQSLRQLAGGVSRPLDGLREDLLDLLADLEAGLDFADEDIEFVERSDALLRLTRALAQVNLVQKQVQDRGIAGLAYRVVLIGLPNAGKSSLFNVLTGKNALVSEMAGTTRDYLVAQIEFDGQTIELIDTAGLQLSASTIDSEAQQLAQEVASQADLVLICREFGGGSPIHVRFKNSIMIATKCDIKRPLHDIMMTSAKSGEGLESLRMMIATKARARSDRGLAPSLTRCRHHVVQSLEHLRCAYQNILFDDPPEIVATELRAALNHLGELTGAVYTDDLLDRVFSRFCIGK